MVELFEHVYNCDHRYPNQRLAYTVTRSYTVCVDTVVRLNGLWCAALQVKDSDARKWCQ